MVKLKRYFFHSYKKIITAAARFPFMTASAFMAFVFTLFYNHFYIFFDTENKYWLFLILEAITGIAVFFSFAIYSEKNKVDIGKRLGLALLGFCILGLHYYSLPDWAASIDSTYFLRYIILFLVFVLLASFVVFYSPQDEDAFWRYNQYLLIHFIVASAYTLVLFIGLSSALYAVESLFALSFPDSYYVDLFIFFVVFVNTLFFSSSLPEELDSFKDGEDYKNALRVFIQYVLLPILFIYLAILAIYFGKVLLTSAVPTGLVCKPILIFACIGVLTYLLSYPIRADRRFGIIHFFCRYFFYFLIPLIVLYFVGLLTRVFSYGLTEWRYVGLIMGVWLLGISLYSFFVKKQQLVFFPISLFLLLILGSAGPWGMFQMSPRSQFNRLSGMLEAQHLIKNKVLDVSAVSVKMTDSVKKEISSITKFLFYREKIELIYPILAEREKKQIDKILKGDDKVSAFNSFLEKTFKLQSNDLLQELKIYEAKSEPFMKIELEGYNYLKEQEFGSILLSSTNKESALLRLPSSFQSVSCLDFLKKVYAKLSMQNIKSIDEESLYFSEEFPVDFLSFTDSTSNEKVYFKQLEFSRMDDSTFEIRRAHVFILSK